MRLSPTADSTIPVTSPAVSTSAPPDDAGLDTAPVSSRPLVVGPFVTDTMLSVEASTPVLSHGDVPPGLDAPTTHTVSPVLGARCADSAAGSPASRRSSTRSLVASRPTTRAECTKPSCVVTLAVAEEPTRRSLVMISFAVVTTPCERRRHTPEPRRVPDLTRTHTAPTDLPTVS